MITIDGRVLDTDNRFYDYCLVNHIKDPFRESNEMFARRCSTEERNGHTATVIREKTEEEKAWEKDWAKRRDEYLRLNHTFRMWDFHFWMDDWEKFQWYGRDVDMNIYMPCDIASRQCNMMCLYFGGKCPRETEELQAPEILGFKGRWEFHDEDVS